MSVLNDLELTLIFMLDFDVQVQPEEFNLYRDSLRRGEFQSHTSSIASWPTFFFANHIHCLPAMLVAL